ncbi:DUF882 domain-containing protein [Reyranella sp. CPCC 100927]|uniref:DUF882 domain-containing protein n=1 Tax=Reyranella sp. CPCC 100927 TaxID=2599616 RepID=UPI0011B4147B|nr:DUF882 domain-containing protein [Reyranella sp. CPCC 100927]TWT03061.1 DUF882 domain-containing protein [Reyranella sp. CPCC 100927]
MAAAKYVTALLAFAVGISIVSNGMAQSTAPKKVTVSKAPAKQAAATAQKPVTKPTTKPAVVSAKTPTTKTAATTQRPGATKSSVAARQQVASRQNTRVSRIGYGGRAIGSRAPATLRSTRFGAVPVMPSLYAPPQEKLPPPPDDGSPRTLSFYSVNSQESLTVTYRRDGRYVQSELDRVNAFLRDSRNGDSVQMDPQLFDILWHVKRSLGADGPYEVLSAYRSPETNAWLASASRGVASDSLHMRGQAMDVKLPGYTAYQIRQAARDLGLGGVGYYPRSGFVHLDTGSVRYW